MSKPSHTPRPGPSPLINDVEVAIAEPSKLSELVRRLMEMQREDALRLIGRNTTRSGIRRIHEYVTSAIDISMSILRKSSGDDVPAEDANRIALMLTRGLILVKYQAARGQLGGELPALIEAAIKKVLKTVKPTGSKRRDIERVLESARTLMDGLLVLAYMHAR